MRTIKELLQLMLDNKQLFKEGLCNWKDELWITDGIDTHEYIHLGRYIANNRPSPFSSINAFVNRNWVYYWTKGDIKPRIKWLKKHIAKN